MVISYSQLMKLSTKKDYTVEIKSGEPIVVVPSSKYKNYTLYFKGEVNISDFTYTKSDRDLLIKNSKYDVTVKNYFSADGTKTSSQVKYIKYDYMGGKTVSILDEGFISADWLNFTPNKKGVVTGSMFSDSIDMTNALTVPLNSKNKGLTINGGKGGDIITGTAFNDVISGGAGINIYNYDFGKQSGQDTIKLTKGETLKLNLKNGNQILNCGDVSYAKLLNNLIIYRNGDMSNMINLNNFFKLNVNVQIADNSMNDYLKSDDFEGLNISGVGKIAGTNYNDMIMGSDKNDTITAKAGNDTISTNGGKDTVVETGVYGHDIIDSSLSSKVTVKLSSFDANNITYGDDLKYTTDDKSSFTYLGFGTGESTDLWISAGKKSYHVTKENAETVDYSKDKSNHIVFLTGDNQTIKTSGKGTNVFYALDGTNDYTLKGGNDSIVDKGQDDDTYTAIVNKSTKLVINDDGGNDSLTLNNKSSDLVLFYNTDNNGNTDDDLVIYNKNAVSYSGLSKGYKNNSYTGGIQISNYFADNELENISYVSGDNNTNIDIKGWKFLLDVYIADYLKSTNIESVKDVLENGSKKQKQLLTNIFKTTTYSVYENMLLSSSKYSDIQLENDNNILYIYEVKDGDKKLLYYPIQKFLGTDSDEIFHLLVLDDNGRLMSMNIDSEMNLTYGLDNDNVVTFDSNEKYSDINFVNDGNTLKIYGKDNALLYTVNNFAENDDKQKIILNVLDNNDKEMSISINSLMNKEFNMGNDNVVTFDSSEKYSDINFVNNNGTLKVYGKNNTLLYTVNDFVSANDTQKIILNVLDNNNKAMSISLNSQMNKEYNLGNDNIITLNSSEKYSDINFVNNNGTLKVYGKNNTLLYTVNDFASANDTQKIILNVLDNNNKTMSVNLNSQMNKEYNLGNDNTVSILNNSINPIVTVNGSKDTLIFEDKKYTDFYTTGELSGAYTAGDPLIAKDGNDLKIGSVTVKDIDGMKNEIQIVDKDGKTKNIIIGQGTINGTHESEIIIGSNTADTINSNGRNDLIYMGDGNDTLNMTKTEGGETGKNTAEMIGIGGTHSISNDLDIPATSVYDSTGNDTYNTTLKEFGLYIEDFAGNNDTLNITYSDNNLMYLFDVVNPKHASENPTLYTDLMICDKSQFTDAGLSAFSTATGGFKAMLESMQGTFGYAWIDDHFGGKQEIENINIIDADGNSSALDVDAAIASTQQKIAAWLSSDTGFFKPSGDFSTAWDVLERGSKADKAYLATLYMS